LVNRKDPDIIATSCGGVVIFKGKILLLYKNYRNRYDGWVLPKGTVEAGEDHMQTALREVKEETGVSARIVRYIDHSQYYFTSRGRTVRKQVFWYLMTAQDFFSRPQQEEYFTDSGYYKYHEAYHLMKYTNERRILVKACQLYQEMMQDGSWK